MEQGSRAVDIANPLCCVHVSRDVERGIYQRNSFVDSLLTEAVMSEIKRQSSNGCLLCSFDEWEGEDWD